MENASWILFETQGKCCNYSCVIYKGDFSCNQNYIAETPRNA